MSHMLCICGHDMPDNTTQLPYAAFAYVLRNQNADDLWNAVYQDLDSFAAALAANRRDVWLNERFGDQYPCDLADRDVLEDAISRHFHEWSLAMFQCENCGRLWVQDAPFTNHYRSFRPEGEWRDTLAVQKTAPKSQGDEV